MDYDGLTPEQANRIVNDMTWKKRAQAFFKVEWQEFLNRNNLNPDDYGSMEAFLKENHITISNNPVCIRQNGNRISRAFTLDGEIIELEPSIIQVIMEEKKIPGVKSIQVGTPAADGGVGVGLMSFDSMPLPAQPRTRDTLWEYFEHNEEVVKFFNVYLMEEGVKKVLEVKRSNNPAYFDNIIKRGIGAQVEMKFNPKKD